MLDIIFNYSMVQFQVEAFPLIKLFQKTKLLNHCLPYETLYIFTYGLPVCFTYITDML